MISPDDPRHGQERGYRAGCRERCCKDATALYQRRRSKLKAMGHDRRVDPTGTKRRIQALQALGWTQAHIAEAGGFSSADALNKTLRDSTSWVFSTTLDRAKRAYAALSMRPGPSELSVLHAARRGWPPPLAWDDDQIDDPAAVPCFDVPAPADADDYQDDGGIDEVLVQRALDGHRVKATTQERAEIIRRWLAAGRPQAELNRLQGWNIERDRRRKGVAA